MDHYKGSLSVSFDVLPSSQEVTQIFKDFRQVLQVHRYKTPLQRADHLLTRNCSIALEQKNIREAERVFNLLPPGHHTRHKVDFLNAIVEAERPITLRIPITLQSNGSRYILLRTSSSGQVVLQKYTHPELAFSSFRSQVLKTTHRKAYFPLFVHKSSRGFATFHSDFDSALIAWNQTTDFPHQLQQFVQPFSKSITLVRAHWKSSRNVATFYFISHGPVSLKARPSLVSHMNHSFSYGSGEAFHACVSRSSSNLIVQKSKSIPELDNTIAECVRLLNASLKDNQRVIETVCDFVSDWTHQWVFLGCKGYRFQSKTKIKTETLAPRHEIDLKYLIFPLVARKATMKKKINRTLLLESIAMKRRISIFGVRKKDEDYKANRDVALLGASSLLNITTILENGASSFNYRQSEPTMQDNLSISEISNIHNSLLSREVHKFESLVKGSRIYKEEIRGTIDIVAKYGGVDLWRPLLVKTVQDLVANTEVSGYFEEKPGVEECHMKVCGLMRILRGNYNFYYKEALGKLHQRKIITLDHFHVFLQGLENSMKDMQVSDSDADIVVKRFRNIARYVCVDGEEVRKQDSAPSHCT